MTIRRAKRTSQGELRRKTAQEEAVFNSHDWSTERVHNNNVYGEPVYITICQNCKRLVSEVQRTQQMCDTKGKDDQRSTGPVP